MYEEIIGEDTPEEIIPCILNFYECLMGKIKLPEIISSRFELVRDKGVEFRDNYGDASDGKFGVGDYRIFLVRDKVEDKTFLAGFSILPTGKTFNDPKYGNSSGRSVLVMIYEDEKVHKFSAQINLNKFLTVTKDKAAFRHNAVVNVQGGGQRKADLLKYVAQNNPNLVTRNEIYLGSIDVSKNFTLQSADVVKLISNLVEYSVYVVEYKQLVVKNRQAGKL